MDTKRGILISLALYFATMIIGVILTILTRTSMTVQSNPTIYWIITIITTVLLTCLASLWYFNKAKRNTKEGLKLGITFILVGFVVDLIFFLTQKGGIQIMKEYYSNISFYIVVILVIASTVFIGSRYEMNHSKKEVKVTKKKKK